MGKRKRKGSSSSKTSSNNNPLLRKQAAFLNQQLSKTERDAFFSNQAVNVSRRAEIWMQQADLGESLVNRYSWATPDERALRILKHFSPIIEIGCGANAYWCRQMKHAGIDVVGYDLQPQKGGTISQSPSGDDQKKSFPVKRGGPEVLERPENRQRTLFLCYPDENDDVQQRVVDAKDKEDGNEHSPVFSLGSDCLQHYQGDYIIHVGELFTYPNLSLDQAPWGRSSSPEFQQQLAAQYHCLLQIGLPSWLHVRDSLTVWKRSETCTIVFAADEQEDGDEDEEFEYRHIPVEERMPMDVAAPCLEHLLRSGPDDINVKSDTMNTPKMTDPAPQNPSDSKPTEYTTPW